MTKKLVLLQYVTTFKSQYVVEVDSNSDVKASDINPMELQDEFSSIHLSDIPYDTREITQEEYLRLFDENNAYLLPWPIEKKLSLINK